MKAAEALFFLIIVVNHISIQYGYMYFHCFIYKHGKFMVLFISMENLWFYL